MTRSARPAGAISLRALYLLTFIFIGGFANFVPLWLRDADWNEPAIGWLTALRAACLLAFPLLWGRLSDRGGDSVKTLRLLALGSLVCLSPIVLTTSLVPVLASMTAFSVFWVAHIPTVDSVVLSHVDQTRESYGSYRVWGSAGFIVGGFLVGAVVERFGSAATPRALIVMLACVAALVLLLPRERRARTAHPAGLSAIRALLADRDIRALYLVTFASRFASQGLYVFLPHHLRDLGVSDALVPTFWAAGVTSEIILIRMSPTLFRRWRLRSVLLLCFGAAVLQYGLTAMLTDPWLLLPVMTLHGLSFGVWYVTSITWLGRRVPDSDRATAQALFQMTGFGIGGVLSAIGAGYLYDIGQGPLMWGTAAALSVGTVLFAAFILPRAAPPEPLSPGS